LFARAGSARIERTGQGMRLERHFTGSATMSCMQIRVECYSGRKGDERPVRFQVGERFHIVEEILDQWYGPGDSFFKVRADDGNLYILRRSHSASEGSWTLESFRQLQN
jgi:hypothetical protein